MLYIRPLSMKRHWMSFHWQAGSGQLYMHSLQLSALSVNHQLAHALHVILKPIWPSYGRDDFPKGFPAIR